MTSRRSFFKALAAVPVTLAVAPKELVLTSEKEIINFPIDLDLSLTGVQWALFYGIEHKFGSSKKLVCSPPALFAAREVVNHPSVKDEKLLVEVRELPNPYQWFVVFEDGSRVGSRGV